MIILDNNLKVVLKVLLYKIIFIYFMKEIKRTNKRRTRYQCSRKKHCKNKKTNKYRRKMRKIQRGGWGGTIEEPKKDTKMTGGWGQMVPT